MFGTLQKKIVKICFENTPTKCTLAEKIFEATLEGKNCA